ncbi:hypothetical protein EDM56_19750 [Brevibacillus fluminis]|uniref:Uncharacterized protein n=1 Tax=Brevibacillus fluminis TaxID=511487 RepID=A0A3M8DAR6_9BACL|nr:hypothetical protein [Brevibacillus fluminis]RNB85144.1 hypothetical protein EDM56_19750 [Brevibacillus fluminis]
MWIPYETIRKHPADFRITYTFFTEAEGGRKNPVFQGLRCDFSYAGDDVQKDGLFAIHPEFEDKNGEVIMDNTIPVSGKGTARMWILFPEMRREVHLERIKVGVRGFFMEGPRKIASIEVIELVGLRENAHLIK